MSQKLFISAFYLIATISVFLVICEATSPAIENRATSPARIRSKKPPFNGSMFGKRSLAPALSRPSYVTKSMDYINPADSRDEEEENYEYGGTAIESLAIKMTQDEPLIQASIDQCVQIQRSSDRDPFLANLCSNLLGNRVRENNLWIKQLLGLDRFYR